MSKKREAKRVKTKINHGMRRMHEFSLNENPNNNKNHFCLEKEIFNEYSLLISTHAWILFDVNFFFVILKQLSVKS